MNILFHIPNCDFYDLVQQINALDLKKITKYFLITMFSESYCNEKSLARTPILFSYSCITEIFKENQNFAEVVYEDLSKKFKEINVNEFQTYTFHLNLSFIDAFYINTDSKDYLYVKQKKKYALEYWMKHKLNQYSLCVPFISYTTFYLIYDSDSLIENKRKEPKLISKTIKKNACKNVYDLCNREISRGYQKIKIKNIK